MVALYFSIVVPHRWQHTIAYTKFNKSIKVGLSKELGSRGHIRQYQCRSGFPMPQSTFIMSLCQTFAWLALNSVDSDQ